MAGQPPDGQGPLALKHERLRALFSHLTHACRTLRDGFTSARTSWTSKIGPGA